MEMRMWKLHQNQKLIAITAIQQQKLHSHTVYLSPSHIMDPNTAAKIRGCFIGIPGSRKTQPAERDDMDLGLVSDDLHLVSTKWWSYSSRNVSRPQIANSDRSVYGILDVRSVVLDLASRTDFQGNSCFRPATS